MSSFTNIRGVFPDDRRQASTLVKIAHAESKVREALDVEKTTGKKEGQKSEAAHASAAPVDSAGIGDEGEHATAQPDLFAGKPVLPAGVTIEEAILAAGEGELPIPPRAAWEMVGGRAGEVISRLVQHGEADGPRHDARPA